MTTSSDLPPHIRELLSRPAEQLSEAEMEVLTEYGTEIGRQVIVRLAIELREAIRRQYTIDPEGAAGFATLFGVALQGVGHILYDDRARQKKALSVLERAKAKLGL